MLPFNELKLNTLEISFLLYTVKTEGDKPVPFGNLGWEDGNEWNHRVTMKLWCLTRGFKWNKVLFTLNQRKRDTLILFSSRGWHDLRCHICSSSNLEQLCHVLNDSILRNIWAFYFYVNIDELLEKSIFRYLIHV